MRAADRSPPQCQLIVEDVFWIATILHTVDMTHPSQSALSRSRVYILGRPARDRTSALVTLCYQDIPGGGGGCPIGLERCTGDRVVQGSNPAAAIRFRTLAIPFTPLCWCLSEETLKAVGPVYLVSIICQGSKISHQPALECDSVTVVDSHHPLLEIIRHHTGTCKSFVIIIILLSMYIVFCLLYT